MDGWMGWWDGMGWDGMIQRPSSQPNSPSGLGGQRVYKAKTRSAKCEHVNSRERSDSGDPELLFAQVR